MTPLRPSLLWRCAAQEGGIGSILTPGPPPALLHGVTYGQASVGPLQTKKVRPPPFLLWQRSLCPLCATESLKPPLTLNARAFVLLLDYSVASAWMSCTSCTSCTAAETCVQADVLDTQYRVSQCPVQGMAVHDHGLGHF